jgi:hypothetical protein
MIPRLFSTGVALVALLAMPLVCFAQGATTSAPRDSGAAPGRGGIGGMLGGGHFIADADYSAGAQPRLVFAGYFRYVVNDWLRLQFSPGYTWTAYKSGEPFTVVDPNFPADSTKDEVVVQLVPVSLQFQFIKRSSHWLYHAGFGPGLYRVWVTNRRKVLKDPVSKELHRDLYWGVSGQFGAERFLASLPNTSIEMNAAANWVFSQDDDNFPSGYNSFLANVEFKIGVNYYWDLVGESRLTDLPPGASGE